MRAAVVTDLNGPDGVVIREVPDPTLKPGHVLIDVEYAGISFPDVLQTRGQYQVRPELPFTPGWEISGVVREDSGSFRAGDRVAAMPFTGGVAESVVVDANYVFALPDFVSFATAAALPLNYLTAHFALVRRAKLQPGETVLVQGAAGGVGTRHATWPQPSAQGSSPLCHRLRKSPLPRPPVLTMSCLRMASRLRCVS